MRLNVLAIFFANILFAMVGLQGQTVQITKYLEFLKGHPFITTEIGNYKEGEIEIVIDEKKIHEIEEMQKMRCKKKGMSDEEAFESSRVGVIAEDDYWVWIRDAVIFPTGAEGTFNRLVKKSAVKHGTPGIAVLPVLPDGRIVLNLNYRHAARSWQLEIPRGQRCCNESVEETVSRELKEETGLILSKIHRLGEVFPDSGCMSCTIPVYLGIIDKKETPHPDFSEAILRIEAFKIEDIREALARGWIEMDIKKKKEKVMISDPFLAYAILQAEYKKLLPHEPVSK